MMSYLYLLRPENVMQHAHNYFLINFYFLYSFFTNRLVLL